jgi:hypothetical protein
LCSLPEQGLTTSEELIDIATQTCSRDTYDRVPLINFWAGLEEEFLQISSLAAREFLPFVSTYLCESGFSRFAATKTKYRSGLNAEHDMRIQLSDIVPDFKPHYVQTDPPLALGKYKRMNIT